MLRMSLHLCHSLQNFPGTLHPKGFFSLSLNPLMVLMPFIIWLRRLCWITHRLNALPPWVAIHWQTHASAAWFFNLLGTCPVTLLTLSNLRKYASSCHCAFYPRRGLLFSFLPMFKVCFLPFLPCTNFFYFFCLPISLSSRKCTAPECSLGSRKAEALIRRCGLDKMWEKNQNQVTEVQGFNVRS